MLGAIKYAFANLANVSGRDSRQTFWFWVLFVVIVRFLAGMAISLPMTGKIMSAVMQVAQSGGDQDPAAIQAMMNQIISEELPRMVWIGVGIGVVSMLLLCASLVRRLHDSDLSGWLVLIPGGIYAVMLANAPRQIEVVTEMLRNLKPGMAPDTAAMMHQQGLVPLLGWVAIALVIWIGVRKSSEGPNRFGDAPVSF